jgi:uronate dehydrogenase
MNDVTKPPSYNILITGGSGAVGRAIIPFLRQAGHHCRVLDPQPAPHADESVIGSVADLDLLESSLAGIDTLIHLAATVDDADFHTQLVQQNLVAVYDVLAAAARRKLRRVVLASSIQATGPIPDTTARPIKISDGAWPRNMYGASKVFAEAAGMVFAQRDKLSVVAVRIGWMVRNRNELGRIETATDYGKTLYLSWDDAGRFFTAAVAAERPGYSCYYCMSRGAMHNYDLQTPQNEIGYEPQDHFGMGLPFLTDEERAQVAALRRGA